MGVTGWWLEWDGRHCDLLCSAGFGCDFLLLVAICAPRWRVCVLLWTALGAQGVVVLLLPRRKRYSLQKCCLRTPGTEIKTKQTGVN